MHFHFPCIVFSVRGHTIEQDTLTFSYQMRSCQKVKYIKSYSFAGNHVRSIQCMRLIAQSYYYSSFVNIPYHSESSFSL